METYLMVATQNMFYCSQSSLICIPESKYTDNMQSCKTQNKDWLSVPGAGKQLSLRRCVVSVCAHKSQLSSLQKPSDLTPAPPSTDAQVT